MSFRNLYDNIIFLCYDGTGYDKNVVAFQVFSRRFFVWKNEYLKLSKHNLNKKSRH